MINVNDIPTIANYLSSIFFFGFSYEYSEEVMEGKIINSTFFDELENGDSSFVINKTPGDIISSMFGGHIQESVILNTNSLSLWLGEVYTKIFFEYHKSFSYIFLYLPLKSAVELFPVYHEMDLSKTLQYFKSLTEEESLLTLLLKKNDLTISELSLLTNINYNTVVSFTRDNTYLYNAKFDSIYKISQVLKVKINIFAETIYNYPTANMYAYDRTDPIYRLYLAYYISSYFDKDIRNQRYNLVDNVLVSKQDEIVTLWTSSITDPIETYDKNQEIMNVVSDYRNQHKDVSNTILVVFEFNQISNCPAAFMSLSQMGFKKIAIINESFFFQIEKARAKMDPINNLLSETSNFLARKANDHVSASGGFAPQK